MLLDSPLLPTDHRDSPQTLTTTYSPVNTFTTRCSVTWQAGERRSPTCCVSTSSGHHMLGQNVIAANLSSQIASTKEKRPSRDPTTVRPFCFSELLPRLTHPLH